MANLRENLRNNFEIPFLNRDEAYSVLGAHDEFLRVMKSGFDCQFVSRGDSVAITGNEAERAAELIFALQSLFRAGALISSHEIHYGIRLAKSGSTRDIVSLYEETAIVSAGGRRIFPRTVAQRDYLRAMQKSAVTLGMGPAGTGKTYLAVARAVSELRERRVRRIILTRPAVEAGERLGFLPGDMQEKVDPYLRPLYDALSDLLGFETYQRMIAKGIIEIAPLAYMRGRTLSNSFVIIDEAQNTTPRQMKMLLTRLGQGSRIVVTGDPGQTDLPNGAVSGLVHAAKALSNVDGVSVFQFETDDIIRHEMVMKIVEAYERYETHANHTEAVA